MMKVGDKVRYHDMETGWQFGRVIGRHRDDIGINPSGLEYATVRFPQWFRYDRAPTLEVQDRAIPCLRLELCGDCPE
jgi:hypothetical protein